jgi:hypothetical protein
MRLERQSLIIQRVFILSERANASLVGLLLFLHGISKYNTFQLINIQAM